MTTVAPITTRTVRLTVREAAKGGRRRSFGRVDFSFDGTRVVALARRSTNVIAEGEVAAILANGSERWKITLENGDVWEAAAGCGCGG